MRSFLTIISGVGLGVCTAANIATYFAPFSLGFALHWLAVPTAIVFAFNVPVIYGHRARGMSWYQLSSTWLRLLCWATMLYPLVITIVDHLNYPHHYNPRTGWTMIDAPPRRQETLGTAVLMVFWACTLAIQSSVLNKDSSRQGAESNSMDGNWPPLK